VETSSKPRGKHRDSFSFQPYCKLVFSTNKLPPVRDDEVDAFFKRWLIVEFPYQFEDDPGKRKEILESCTTDEEKSGILNWALEGLRRLLRTGKFTADEGDSAKIRDRWMRETNPAYDFLTTHVERDPTGAIMKKNLWTRYLTWREEQGLPTIERQNEFSQLVQALFRAESKRVRIQGELHHVWVGIRWKEQEKQDQEPSTSTTTPATNGWGNPNKQPVMCQCSMLFHPLSFFRLEHRGTVGYFSCDSYISLLVFDTCCSTLKNVGGWNTPKKMR